MTTEEISEILKLHKAWLNGEKHGKRASLSGASLSRANLSRANLSGASLSGADLYGASLSGADLYGANLYGANLSGANLSGASLSRANLSRANLSGASLSRANLSGASLSRANLSGASLYGADLSGASLYGADLYGANLYGANLSGANLYGAKNVPYTPMACPDEGEFIGWKKCRNGRIVKLKILEDAKRSSATGRKCRCDKAEVLEITSIDGTEKYTEAVSDRDADFAYTVGEMVSVDDFCENRWEECAVGIHFFMNRKEAVDYRL